MKLILTVLITCGMFPHAFADVRTPADFCASGRCTENMRSIVDDFLREGRLTDLAKGPALASGACYHIHPSYSPDHEHHGLALLETRSEEATFMGLFSFFARSNPWEGLTTDEGRERLLRGGSSPKTLVTDADEHRLVLQYENARLSYWIRELPSKNEVLLISEWAFTKAASQLIFCRLGLH